jgi:ABC-type multidrug transport system fused ATPase/permease subunit
METKKEDVLRSIEKLADKLGVTAETIFGYYIKNAKTFKYMFWINLVLSILGIIIGIIPIYFTYEPIINYDASVLEFIGFILGIIISAIGLISFMIQVGRLKELINAYINPEYEALEDLFSSIFD